MGLFTTPVGRFCRIYFEKVNSVTNEAGENVDFMLGTKDYFNQDFDSDLYQGGANKIPKYSTSSSDGIIRPVDRDFGVNKISVFVERDKDDRDWFQQTFGENVVNHEAGHFLYMVLKAADYSKYLDKLKEDGREINGGHNTDDESGKQAEDYGAKKDIKEGE